MTAQRTIETVTPALAEAWLKRAGIANATRDGGGMVANYAIAMKAGRWQVQTDSFLEFDRDGLLLDGARRLLACIQSDSSFETDVVRRDEQPLTTSERLVFGSHASRCPVTGIPFEQGRGAASRERQSAMFARAAQPSPANLEN